MKKNKTVRSFLIAVFLVGTLFCLLFSGWWALGQYRHQSVIDWQEIEKEDYVDSKKINAILENRGLEYEYQVLQDSSQYTYELVFGRYEYRQNAVAMKAKIEGVVGEMIIKKNKQKYWELRSVPMTSRNRVDLMTIRLNHLQISPQILRKKIAR